MHIAGNLAGVSGIAHGFFGRKGGVSTGLYESLNCGPGSNDDRTCVIENRRIALALLADGAPAELVSLYQVHSNRCVPVTQAWQAGEAPQADAMVTGTTGLALGILTADCAPVLFADGHAQIIGAAHAGWKGALGGIVESTVAAMERLGAERARIRAAIGPAISQRNYEVGPDFRQRFLDSDSRNDRFFVASDRADHFCFALEAFVVARLEAAKVGDIVALSLCTYENAADFYSFRRTTHRGEADYGREISAIMLLP